MTNKSEMMEAIMMGNSNNMRMIEDLTDTFDAPGVHMINAFYNEISYRNYCIERAKPFWDDISEERIKLENDKVVEDSKKIVEIGQLLDKLKELIEEA